MAKRDKKRPQHQLKSSESRSIEMATTAWMLTVVTTLVCEILTAGSRWYVAQVDPEALMLGVFSGLMLFASFALGVFALALQAVVLRWRKHVPPRPVVVGATLVAVAPILAATIIMLR